jgi:hypothetical protein
MFTKLSTVAATAVALTALAAAPAFAAVSYDAAAGTGFVGKGDVQTVFGWNNKVSQAAYSGVTFRYDATATYSQDCEKHFTKEEWQVVGTEPVYNRLGTIIRHDDIRERVTVTTTNAKTFRKTASISSALTFDAKKTGQMTGYFLKEAATEGSTAAPTDLCTPGVGEEGQSGWLAAVAEDGSVAQVVAGERTGGLLVTHGGVTHPLPNTPVLVP